MTAMIDETASPTGDVKRHPLRVAVIGNYLPRQCGIATFTTDLCEALAAERPESTVLALPVNDTEAGYEYPERVRFELAQNDLPSYRRAADFLNINSVEQICVQHEYGIFGGPSGSHILALLKDLRMPVVTTLHTILKSPSPTQRKVMAELADLSDRFVVMSQRGAQFLAEIYEVPPSRIDVIPHGIPDVPFVDPNFFKDHFGVEGRMVLLTFGLLSPSKGLENVIQTLPEVLRARSDVVYIVLGATHPHVLRRDGELYRLSLQRLAEDLGVEQSVIFHNRFVSPEELIEFIGAADIYVTPYLNAEQIVSGTLAYAVGAGKAVVSTPYWYAEELLTEGRGMLVPFGDARAIAQAILHLLEDKGERHAMRKRAYTLGREMIWSEVARRYWESFSRAHEDRSRHPRPAFTAPTLDRRPRELPPLRLNHLRHLTDETGILQHSVFTVPNYAEGYCTDDNARALLVCVLLEEDRQDATFDVLLLASRYLGFLGYAFDGLSGRFRNFLKYDRRWQEGESSEDCHGRALWALGTVLGRSGDEGLRGVAGKLFEASLPATLEMTNPRAWAFTILGIHEYLKAFFGDRAAQNTGAVLAERLRDLHRRNHSSDWPWFESTLTYNNATLSHALLQASQWLSRPELAEAALDSLAWLTSVQRAPEGHFVPVGSPGWYPRGGPRARFDQQPLEAQATLSACLEAHRLTGEGKWRREAERCFEWFLGRNDLKAPLYNPTTGGCRDGLHPERVNQNQGAESTLSFLLSLLEMRLSETAFASVSKHDSFSA